MTACRQAIHGIAGAIVLCWAGTSAAYRPFDGTDADVAEPGEIELEIGPVGYHHQGSSRFIVAPALIANYGFAPDFEAVLEGRQYIPINATEDTRQIQDVALSVKSLLRHGSLQGGSGLSIAVENGLLLPGSESRLGIHVGSIFSLRWPALTLHLNLGNDLYSARYDASVSLILEGPARWRIRPVAEILVERAFGPGGFWEGFAESALLGGIGRWTDALSFDTGVRFGRADGQREQEFRAGLTWAFAPW
jgi:hypothetical protein